MEIRISVLSVCRLFYVCILSWNEVSKPVLFLEGREANISRNLMNFNENSSIARNLVNFNEDSSISRNLVNFSDTNPARQSAPIVDEKTVGTCQLLYNITEVPESDDPLLFTYPKCVKIKKCQGCCVSKQMSCQPKSTRIRQFQIHRFRYTKTQTEIVKNDVLNLEEHLSCGCDCKRKPEDCSVNQVYERNICDCACQNAHEAKRCSDRKKIWDQTSCQCICRDFRLCSGSYVFDRVKCRCKYNGLSGLS